MFNFFPSKHHHTILVNPPLRGFSYMNSTSKAAFEKKAFKVLPVVIGEKLYLPLGLFPT